MSFRGALRSSGNLQAYMGTSGVLRRNCKSRCAAAVSYYSQDVHQQIPLECPMHGSKLRHQRNKSSMVDIQLADLDTSFTEKETGLAKPFEEIPIPGGYDKGIMGIVAPIYHAWRGRAFAKPHQYMQECVKEVGPIFRQKSLMGWIVTLSDPDDFEKVFRRVGKYPNRPVIQSWINFRHEKNLSLGLLTSEGEDWQKFRSAVSKGILKPSALKSHVGSMHEVVLECVDKLKSIRRQDGVIPNMETELYKWALESSSTFFFDKRLNLISEKVLKKENQDFFDALQILTWETSKLFMLPDMLLKMYPANRNPVLLSMKAWGTLFTIAKNYIDEKMSSLAKAAVRGEDLDDGTFVAYLMLQDKLTPEEIYGCLAEIMPASVDTTAHTSAWAVHLISQNPQIQEKMYQEIQRVNPEGATPSQEMLDSMPYMRAVVKETQRLYPITLATARILEDDIELKGYNIPKGTHITTMFYTACRDPKVFDDPEEFRPERWLDKTKKYHPYASLPFGHGTRMCVGRRLAQQEMYLLLSELVRNFKIESTKPDVGSNCGVTIFPETSLEPKLIERRL